MSLPEEVRRGVEEALATGGSGSRIVDARTVGGGSIHRAFRVETDGPTVFVKWNRGPAAAGFGCEARSLEALRSAAGADGSVRIPAVVGWADAHGPHDPGWLALEHLPPSDKRSDWGPRLGRGLAAIHRHAGESFGWDEDNLIGSLPQPNPRRDSWAVFWREARLEPQLAAARDRGHFTTAGEGDLDRALEAVDRALEPVEHEPPSLLHGDLWGGNAHPGPDGRPVLVDPASFHGHREVDLAMSELFGGFPGSMRRAYEEAWPLEDGYDEVRRPLYQLYYLLVHVNLFGESYVSASRQAARRVLAAL